jgi:hypothetical protein
MSSVKCPECNLTNWSTAITCKRCGNFLQPGGENPVSPQAPPEYSAGQSFIDANQGFDQQESQTSEYAPQSQFSAPLPSQNYQEPNHQYHNQQQTDYQYQNYQQSNYQYYSPVNLKNGIAIASMVLGILSFVTSIFLIGILFAPIGLILGIIALIKANKKPDVYGGKGFAIAGIATSGIMVLFVPIIMAIAIPNLLASRRAANEGNAIATIKTISSAEATYMASAYGKCGDLQTLVATKLLDVSLAENEKSGYRFMVINLPSGGCEILATPLSGSTGHRSFYYSTEDGILRGGAKKGLPANKNDFPIRSDFSETQNQLPTGKANEMVAISSLRTLQSAEAAYAATVGNGEGCDIQVLALQGLIKQDLADGEEGGYRFKVVKIPQGWEIFATPISNSSGNRSFYMGVEGVIRGAAKNGLTADKYDPPITF